MHEMKNLAEAWKALRVTLETGFTFYEIKQVVSLAGLDITALAHLEQKPGGGATKGRLLTAIDSVFSKLEDQPHFLSILAEEILQRCPSRRTELEQNLSRLGFSLRGNTVIPIALYELPSLENFPEASHEDLTKAVQRLRDGDLSGAISSACGAVDTATSEIYKSENLGDPAKDSFQNRCRSSWNAIGTIKKVKKELSSLDWEQKDVRMFSKNLEGALNQGAFVMQSLRAKMGDVHGTKPILKPLALDCLKWAEIMLRIFRDS